MFSQILNHSLSKSLKGLIKCYSAESAAALLLQGRGVWTGCNYCLQVFSVVRDLLAIINWWQQFRQLYKDRWDERTLQGPKVEESQHHSEQWTYVVQLQKYPKFSQRYHQMFESNLPFLKERWQELHGPVSLSSQSVCSPAGPRAGRLFTEKWSPLFSVTLKQSRLKFLEPKIVTHWTPGFRGRVQALNFQCLKSEGPFKPLPCSVTRSLPQLLSTAHLSHLFFLTVCTSLFLNRQDTLFFHLTDSSWQCQFSMQN